jgi:hypothetical protein
MKAYPERISEAQFLKEAERRFIELLPRLPLHPGSEKHVFNNLMPVLATISAVYLVLRKHGYSVEQIGRLEYEGYLQFFNKIPKLARAAVRRFMVSSWFPGVMEPNLKRMTDSGREDTFFIEYTFENKPCRTTTMTCTRCGMITFMARNELDELKRICNVFDFAHAKSFGFGLKQPSCIGRGDEVCRYVFTSDENDTVVPDELVRILETPMAC